MLKNSLEPCITTRSYAMDKKNDILAWADKSGEFKRQTSVFRDFISSKPDAKFPAEKGRYHLYVSYACPWGTHVWSTDYPLLPRH